MPTYGAVMFNKAITEVLLVQGYFSSKNSWGFPKGKVNEDEEPLACAIREVLEETGYDITDKIRPDVCIRYNLNDTAVCLWVATDVDHDFSFHPHLRKEIRFAKNNFEHMNFGFYLYSLSLVLSNFRTSTAYYVQLYAYRYVTNIFPGKLRGSP